MSTVLFTIRLASLRTLFILLFFPTGIASAQIPINQIDSLNKAAAELQQADPIRAIDLSKKAVVINGNGLYRDGLYRSYLNLGMAYTRISRYDSAVAFLGQAETYFSEGLELGLIKYFLGLNYCNLHGFESARMLFLDAKELFAALEDKKYQADVFRALGFIEMQLRNEDKALIYVTRALQIKQEEQGNASPELLLLSKLFMQSGEIENALKYAKLAKQAAESIGKENQEVEAALQIGFLYKQAAELDSAFETYTDLLEVRGDTPSALRIQVFDSLSRLCRSTGRSTIAIKLIEEQLTSSGIDGRSTMLKLKVNLVELYYSSGKPEQAIEIGEQIQAKLISEGFLPEAVRVSGVLVEAAEHQGNLKLANRYQNDRYQLQEKLVESREMEMQAQWRNRLKLLDLSNEITFESQRQEVSILRKERMVLLISLALGMVLIVLLALLLWYRNQMLKGLAEKDSIKKTMHQAQEDLYKQTLHMMHMNNCLNEVEQQVKLLMAAQPDQKLSKILKSIRMNKSMDRDWDNFNSYFGNVNVGFYEKLSERSDKLSNHDRRVCALIKLNLTNREIATILNIEVKSVSMIKYRIKKKLRLDDAMELSHFITQL